jgi:hypothetical protein
MKIGFNLTERINNDYYEICPNPNEILIRETAVIGQYKIVNSGQ